MATVKWRTMGNNKRSRPRRPLPLARLVRLQTSTSREKMAALIRHGLLGNLAKCTSSLLAVNTASLRRDVTRSKSKLKIKKPKNTFQDKNKSLAAKGFLRYQKVYNPPANVSDQIDQICKDQAIPTDSHVKIVDPLQRFNLFLACEQEFQHSITNSVLCSIETVDNLKEYYQTPVGNCNPLDAMQTMELPKNLHITYQYHRFHPDTDNMFGGKTAFPKSSTIVTGLKYKKKYPGHLQENPYLKNLLKI